MNQLEKLIGQIVNARIEIEEDEVYYVIGEILSVDIDDYYFYEKGEPINITVSISPLEKFDNNIYSEMLSSIPLSHITKY